MITPLSTRLAQGAHDLEDAEDLGPLGGAIEAAGLVDALDHAATLAAEVEGEAARTAWWSGTPISPAYPPLVSLLGRALVDTADQRHGGTSPTTCSSGNKPAQAGDHDRPRAATTRAMPAPGGAR